MKKHGRQRKVSSENNYFWLLMALLFVFFLGAVAAELDMGVVRRLTSVSLTLVVLAAVWSLEQKRFPFSSRLGVTVVFVLIEASDMVFDYYHLGTLQLIFVLLFTLGTIVIACRQVLLTGEVNTNKIVGSICIYLLMGIAWAETYMLLERMLPGSIPALSGDNWREQVSTAMYYSYVTLTTLGFGDISPARPLAQYFTYMQAVVGQFYIAIVVATMIGAGLADDERRKE